MKQKILYCITLLFLLTGSILAQTKNTDIIYLKNGSIIKGEIQESTDESIKIKIEGGSIFVLTTSDIVTIEHVKEEKNVIKPLLKINNKGWYNNVMLGVGINGGGVSYGPSQIMLNVLSSMSFSFQYTTGYRFHPAIGVGLGVGIMNYSLNTSLPIFVNIQGYVLKSPTNIYYNVDVGYGFDLNTNGTSFEWEGDSAYREGGLYFRPAIGVRFPSTKKFSMLMDIGVRVQLGRYVYNYSSGYTAINPLNNYLPSFRVGATF